MAKLLSLRSDGHIQMSALGGVWRTGIKHEEQWAGNGVDPDEALGHRQRKIISDMSG